MTTLQNTESSLFQGIEHSGSIPDRIAAINCLYERLQCLLVEWGAKQPPDRSPIPVNEVIGEAVWGQKVLALLVVTGFRGCLQKGGP